ncbi:rRNA pseudouridine synthase [Janthinobacterium sp.]|uniref:rRNA pseudouridine synthase n=1 Tax=Janthinobacterium sp. TaxID=1871054 RepID=UPI00293D4B2A|nr:rRNA pseudouridine synthase [Janthinobacterium sp.]
MTSSSTDSTVRLAKRLAESLPCSRREAELYIEGGWVSVDGQLVEESGARVAPGQTVELAPGATLEEIPPVTILLHKPAGFNAGIGADGAPALTCIGKDTQTPTDRSGQRYLKRHLSGLTLTNPLDTTASGLLIFTQDFRVARKLVDEAARVEQEYIVEVAGAIVANGLELLNHGLPFNGKALAPIKVSWQNETRLRFALKGVQPGQIAHMCRLVGLSVVAMKRLRVGRMSMAALPSGQWRYLQEFERF